MIRIDICLSLMFLSLNLTITSDTVKLYDNDIHVLSKMAELNYCGRHKIEFSLFCQDCKVEICLMCYIEDHRSHKVKTHDREKQAALEISKDATLSCMAKLKENRDGLEKNITELADNQKVMTEKIAFHFKEVRHKIKNDEAKLKEAIVKHTEIQQSRIEKEIEKIQQKQNEMEDLMSIYDRCLQERQGVESKNSSELPTLSSEIKAKMQCVDFAWAKPTFLPENNFVETLSYNTFGRISLELQGTLSDDELDFDEKLKEKFTSDTKSLGTKNNIRKEENENDKSVHGRSQSQVKKEDRTGHITPKVEKSTESLPAHNSHSKYTSVAATSAVEFPRVKRYTREWTPPPRREETVVNQSPVKLLHSWKTERLKSVAVSDDGLFTIASGESIKQFDVVGNCVNTLARNVNVLPSFMAYSLISNQRHLIQYYGDSKIAEIICLEENKTTVAQLQLTGICVCVSTVEIQDDMLYYQKTTEGKKGSRSASISVIDITEGKLTEIKNINLDMSMVRNFHCINNLQNQFQIVVANKDLWKPKPSHLVALKSFDKGGRVLWAIGRNQLYPFPDFRYDLRSIASDRSHLYVLDYSVGAVHMLTQGGTYLQRVVQHLDRPTHLCVDADRQRLMVVENRKKITVYQCNKKELEN